MSWLAFGLIVAALYFAPKLARTLDQSPAGNRLLWAFAYALVGAVVLIVIAACVVVLFGLQRLV